MSANFTLQQLLLSCMMTGIAVSLLVSSLHAQWGHPAASHTPTLIGGLPAPESAVAAAASAAAEVVFAGGGGAAESGLRSRIQQLSAEVERQRAAALKASASSSPNSAPSPLAQQCPACPSCGPAAAADAASAVASVSAGSSSRIDAAFDAYIDLHRRILAKEPGAPQRFIIARPQAQLNNRLRVIVGGIALGLITGRAFLVDFSSGYYASLSDVFSPPIQMDLLKFEAARVATREALAVDDVETLLCADYSARFGPGVDAIELATPPNLVPFFWRNHRMGKVLQDIFGRGAAAEELVYRSIAARFLSPSETVSGMLAKFSAEHFAAGVYKLGVHLRWGPDFRPQPVGEDEWADMVSCAAAVVPGAQMASGDFVIFVAADTPQSRERAGRELGARFPRARVRFYETWLRSNTPAGVQAALTELLLLSQCDNLVLTPASSYGEQAQALHGRPGYWVRSSAPNPARIQFSVVHEVARNCMRPYSTQPTVEFFSNTIKKASCYHPDMHGISF